MTTCTYIEIECTKRTAKLQRLFSLEEAWVLNSPTESSSTESPRRGNSGFSV